MKKKILILSLFVAIIMAFIFSDYIKIGFIKAFKLSYEIKSLDKNRRVHGRYLKIVKGVIILEGNYWCGSPEGTFKTYYSNGKIKEKVFYKRNKAFGANYGYYENGNLNYKGYNLNGLYGDSFHYDENGQMDVYGANDIEHSFFYYSNYSGLTPINVIGNIFSENIYSCDTKSKKTIILSDKAEVRNISDLYITVANPPQLSREVEVEINKKKWSMDNLKSSTILLQKVFDKKGEYNISIKAKLKDVKKTLFKTDSLNVSIRKM